MTVANIQTFKGHIRKSRRSRFIALALSVAVPLTGCVQHEDDTDVAVQTAPAQTYMVNSYQSVDQCIAANVFTADFCRKAEGTAREDFAKLVPRYDKKEDCEKDWDACDAEGSGDVASAPAPEASSEAASDAVVDTGFAPTEPASAASAAHPGGSGGVARVYSSSYSPGYRGFTVVNDSAQNYRTTPMMRSAAGTFTSTNGVEGMHPGEMESVTTSHFTEPTVSEHFSAGESAHTSTPTRAAPSARSGLGVSGHGFGGEGG